jgi:hypothetical protein
MTIEMEPGVSSVQPETPVTETGTPANSTQPTDKPLNLFDLDNFSYQDSTPAVFKNGQLVDSVSDRARQDARNWLKMSLKYTSLMPGNKT